MSHNKRFGTSKHTEPFRVVTDTYWPRIPDGSHNARYFDYYDDGLHAYILSALNQMFDKRLMERVSFERRNQNGKYYPMFESFQRHTVESYGIDPDEAQHEGRR